jgi:hypothetical protein
MERAERLGGSAMTEETKVNRQERRKAKARARKPLARPGMPMHTFIVRAVIETAEGPKSLFYWFANEHHDETMNMTIEEVVATQELHGPYDTPAEADETAMVAVAGKDRRLTHAGMWDPAWDKPQ